VCVAVIVWVGLRGAQVLNLDDVEGLLGKRPYSSAEMRNIDRFRNGAGAGGDGPAAGAEAAPAEGEGKAEGGGGEGEGGEPGEEGEAGKGKKAGRRPGLIVAT
jgi:AFG3 family protein